MSAPAFLPADAPRRPTLTARLDPDTEGLGAGRRGFLECHVDSDPPAQLRLLHGDHVVATSPVPGGGCSTCGGCSQRVKVNRAPNLLRVEIRDPVLEDEGVYLCEASNTLGNASSSVTFDAQGESGRGQWHRVRGQDSAETLFCWNPRSKRLHPVEPACSAAEVCLLPTPVRGSSSRPGAWPPGPQGCGEAVKVRPVSRGPVLPALQPPSWSSLRRTRCQRAPAPT